MEMLENIGKKVFVLAAMKSICRYSFVCLRCVLPLSMHYRLCLETKWETCQISKEDGLLVRV